MRSIKFYRELPHYTPDCSECYINQQKNCSKDIQNRNSEEKIRQCKLANNLLLKGIDAKSIWIDRFNDDIRYFNKIKKTHLLRTRPKVDIIFEYKGNLYPIEVKYITEQIELLLSNLTTIKEKDLTIYLIEHEYFGSLAQVFTDFFKIHNSVIHSKSDIASYYAYTKDVNHELFNYWSTILMEANTKRISFIIMNDIRCWINSPETPVWHALIFQTDSIIKTANSISCKMTVCYDELYNKLNFLTKKMTFKEEINFNISLFDAEQYLYEINELSCHIDILKYSHDLIVFTCSNFS